MGHLLCQIFLDVLGSLKKLGEKRIRKSGIFEVWEFRTLTSYGSLLPLETQAQLNQARVIGIADLAHGALVEAVFRQLEVCVIEKVEELCAELHSPALREGKILQHGEILADEVRTDQRVAPDVANTSGSGKGKDCGVKRMVRIAHIGWHVAHAGSQVNAV